MVRPPEELPPRHAAALSRVGHTQFNLAQLKIMQEAITLSVFVPFAMLYMNQPFKLDYA